MSTEQKIVTFLWFNNNAEEAVNWYTSVFSDSKITSMSRYGKGSPGPEGSLMVATFELAGQQFMALNGGPMYSFTPAVSLFVNCKSQEEIDHLWEKLSEGGQKGKCGWLTDQFGLSWQIVPTVLGELMSSPDKAKAGRVMQAMMKMTKLEIDVLKQA